MRMLQNSIKNRMVRTIVYTIYGIGFIISTACARDILFTNKTSNTITIELFAKGAKITWDRKKNMWVKSGEIKTLTLKPDATGTVYMSSDSSLRFELSSSTAGYYERATGKIQDDVDEYKITEKQTERYDYREHEGPEIWSTFIVKPLSEL